MISRPIALRATALLVASYPTARIPDESLALYIGDIQQHAVNQSHAIYAMTKLTDMYDSWPSRKMVKDILKSTKIYFDDAERYPALVGGSGEFHMQGSAVTTKRGSTTPDPSTP